MKSEIDLIPSELRAIEVHKYYLSEREGHEVSLEEAMADFLDKYENHFLCYKQAEDNRDQHQEIQRYKWIESEKAGHDIGSRHAALEWIEKYGCIWREERESLEENGFLEAAVLIENLGGARIDMAKLLKIARYFDCDVYIHQPRMTIYNFRLFGKKEYLNVRSLLSPKFLEVAHRETIEFIATGGKTRDALEESARIIRESSSCFPSKD